MATDRTWRQLLRLLLLSSHWCQVVLYHLQLRLHATSSWRGELSCLLLARGQVYAGTATAAVAALGAGLHAQGCRQTVSLGRPRCVVSAQEPVGGGLQNLSLT